jgi:hypothetical protein
MGVKLFGIMRFGGDAGGAGWGDKENMEEFAF